MLAALLAFVASIAGIGNDFVYDDRAMFVDVTRLQGLSHWREILTLPFWPPPFYDLLYRPVTSLLLASEYALGGGSPIVFRIVSIALYAAGAALFCSFALRLVSRNAAIAASALWAVHPVHVEAVAQAVNQSELILGIVALLMVIRYLDARRNGALSRRDWTALAALFVLATLVKESGFILPAVLLLVELLLLPSQPFRVRLAMLWPGYTMLALLAVMVLNVRSLVLSGAVLVANPSAALDGAGLGDRVFAMLQVVPMWLRLFVWPLRLQVDFSPRDLGMPDSFGLPEVAGIVLLGAAASTIIYTRKSLNVACFGLAWCAVTLLPVSNIIPVYFMLAERTLFLPSMGFFIAVAAVGQWVVARSTWPPRRVALVAGCAVLCVLGVIRSMSRHLVWNSAHIWVMPRGVEGRANPAAQFNRSNRSTCTVPNVSRLVMVQVGAPSRARPAEAPSTSRNCRSISATEVLLAPAIIQNPAAS